jgi:DNA repair protein RecO (recombination protein O)
VSHYTYKTEGIILKSWDRGEADKFFAFYTKEYGRVNAHARGVRYLKSKLRYSLSGLSLLRLAFVSTQQGYLRLVDAENIFLYEKLALSSPKIFCLKRIFSLFERLVCGEETDVDAWQYLNEVLSFLENEDIPLERLKDFEIFMVLRMLELLGYSVDGGKAGPVSLDNIFLHRAFWVSLINKTLIETQL